VRPVGVVPRRIKVEFPPAFALPCNGLESPQRLKLVRSGEPFDSPSCCSGSLMAFGQREGESNGSALGWPVVGCGTSRRESIAHPASRPGLLIRLCSEKPSQASRTATVCVFPSIGSGARTGCGFPSTVTDVTGALAFRRGLRIVTW